MRQNTSLSRIMAKTGLVVCVVASAAGCEFAYNGAWLFAPEDQNPPTAVVLPSQRPARGQAVATNRGHQISSRPRTARAERQPADHAVKWPNGQADPDAASTHVAAAPNRSAASGDSNPRNSGDPGTASGTASDLPPESFLTDMDDLSEVREARHVSVANGSGQRALGAATHMGLFGQLPQQGLGQPSQSPGYENLRRVTFTSEGADFDPEIDPTGQFVIFASTQHRTTSDLYIKRVGGTAVTQLTNDPADDMMPAFSPDGQRIAFTSNRSGNWDIYLMDVDGGAPVQLTRDASQDTHPSFSADGSKLVYSSYSVQSGQWEMVVIDVDNPATKHYIGPGLFPQWSPTSNQIVFQRPRQRGTRWFGIWIADVQNGEVLRPTEIAASANAATITPAWSPDGKFVAFSTVVDPDADKSNVPPVADLWIVSKDGADRAKLTHGQFANLQPAWSVDGSIYIVSNRAEIGVENIWSIRADRVLQVIAAPSVASASSVEVSEQATTP